MDDVVITLTAGELMAVRALLLAQREGLDEVMTMWPKDGPPKPSITSLYIKFGLIDPDAN